MVSYSGEFYHFEPMEMNPAPTEAVPLWIGGISDPAMRRAARLADGWVSDLQSSAEIIESTNRIEAWRKEYQRDHLPFDVMATPNDAWEVDGYRRLEDAGVTHIMTIPWPMYHGNSDKLEDKLDAIARFADDVISKFN